MSIDASSKRKPPSGKVFWLVWPIMLALAAGSFWYLARFGPLAAKATVFRQTPHGFEGLPPLGSTAYGMRISDRGVVWVQTVKGLSRLDGGSWHSFTASNFGTDRDFLWDFTLDGEEVWGAASDGIVHFNGKSWRHYANAVAAQHATSIAAANGQAWVIDKHGNLSHFNSGTWNVRKLDLPGVRWSVWASSDGAPKLAVTADGALWLAYEGLWRYNGTSWARVAGATSEARLLGGTMPGEFIDNGKKTPTDGGLWVRDKGEVVGFDVGGALWVRYKMRDLGLLDSTWVYSVGGRAPVFVVGSSQGLTWFDGSQWHGEQLAQLGVVTASSVAVAPDRSVWGIGYPPTPKGSPFYRTVAVVVVFSPFVVIIYPIWYWKRKARYQRQATQEAVLHAMGALPDDLKGSGPSGWRTAGGVVVLFALAFGAYGLVKSYWPAAPVWLLPALFVAVHITATVTGNLKKRKPLPSDPIHPGGLPRYDWAKSRQAIMGGLVVIVLVYGGRIARLLHIPLLAAVPGIVFLFGGQFLFRAYDVFRGHRVEREIKRCHYRKALEMLDGPLGWPSTALWKLTRADALFFSGRDREAEPILRELVETKHDAANKTLAFELLGRVLMAQGRYEDAKRAFEAAAKVMPNRSAAYSGLAELRLLQEVETTQALELAERALQKHRDSLLERKSARHRLANIRGNQAWALAMLGRGGDAQQAIEAGIREMNPNYTPEVAGFYWRAGMAMLALENHTTAVSHFRKAAELDAEGYYGRLAAQHLSRQSVWGTVGVGAIRIAV